MKDKDPMEWEVLESEYLFKKPWLTARREHVKLPTGAEIKDFYVLEYPEFCNVIAITKDGKFLMERQYRHAQHYTGYEIPAGCVEEGEDPMEAAKRELYEETGFGGGEWSKLMTISPNAGACTNYSHTFLAIGVEKLSTQHLEESEDIKVVLMEQDEVIRMLKNDEFHQAMMAAPLWKYFATKMNIEDSHDAEQQNSIMMNFDYLENIPNIAATVCDNEGIVLYQNQRAIDRDGDVLGKNLYNCHGPKAGAMIRQMIEKGLSNTYQIIRHGRHKLLHQTPWYDADGNIGGLIELAIDLPDEMPVFNRDE